MTDQTFTSGKASITLMSVEGVEVNPEEAGKYKCCANCGYLYGHQSVKNWYSWGKNGRRFVPNNTVDAGGICHSDDPQAHEIFGFVPFGAPNQCPSWTHMGNPDTIGKYRLHDARITPPQDCSYACGVCGTPEDETSDNAEKRCCRINQGRKPNE